MIMLSMQNQNGNLLSVNSDLHFVSGMSEARNFMTRNNSKTALFDKDDDIMYIVDTDGFGNKSIVRYRLTEEPEPKMEDMFVTKNDFNDLKGEMADVKQYMANILSELKLSATDAKQPNRSNKKSWKDNKNDAGSKSAEDIG